MSTNRYNSLKSKVLEMRKAQKAYFKDRNEINLLKAKALEREVDALLSEVETKPDNQGNLFEK